MAGGVINANPSQINNPQKYQTMKTVPKTERQLIEIYVSNYPHLAPIAHSGQMRALGDAVSRLAYPTGVTGVDALTISKIGLS